MDFWAVAYAPDGLTLASGGIDLDVRIWDIETGRLLRSLRAHSRHSCDRLHSGRSDLATGSEDRTIRLWNPKTGEPLKLLFTRYDHNVCSLSLSPDGLMLARGSHNKDIKIWEITTGTELMTLLGKTNLIITGPSAWPSRRTGSIWRVEAISARSGCGRCFPVERKRLFTTVIGRSAEDSTETRGYFIEDDGGFQKPMEFWIGAMTFTPDAKLLITGSRDTTIKFFEMPHAAELRVLRGHTGWIRSLAVSPDGKVLVSAGDDHTIRFWEISTGRNFRTLKGHTGPVRGITFSPDGRKLASASWDRTVKLWEGGPEPAE